MKYFASALVAAVSASEAEQYLMRLDHYLYDREDPGLDKQPDHGLSGLYQGDTYPTNDYSRPSDTPTFNPYEFLYSGPIYPTRPFLGTPEEKNIDEPRQKEHYSTADDRLSSSDSDSISSSDEEKAGRAAETCAKGGDPFACKRVAAATQCRFDQTFDRATCTCFIQDAYQCAAIKPDEHGYSSKNNCPADRPNISPIDNCKCVDDATMMALMNHDRGYWCQDNVPSDTSDDGQDAKVRVRVCNSQTDSDSDCVRIGDRKILGERKQIDDNGNEDSSIYEDPNCDPRFSSCDTNSNEEFSNTDSATVAPAAVAATKKQFEHIKGSLAYAYAKRYGVVQSSDTEEPLCFGYDCPHVSCSDGPYGSCYTDPDRTSVYWSSFDLGTD